MEGVSFEEDQFASRTAAPKPVSTITRLAISLGLAKDEAGASRALIVVAALSIIATVVIYVLFRPANHPISQQQFQQDLIRMRSVPHI